MRKGGLPLVSIWFKCGVGVKKGFFWNCLYRFRKPCAVIANNGLFCEQLFSILWRFSSDCHFWAITVLGCIWSKSKLASNASVNSSCAQLPWATAGYLLALSVPGMGHLQILHFPGARHLPTPSFWHACSFLSEYYYTGDFTWKTSRLAHLSRMGKYWRGL